MKIQTPLARLCIATSLLLLSLASWADAGWTGYGAVEEIHVDGSGEFYLKVNGLEDEPSGCKSGGWFSHYSNTPGHEKIYQAVLLAFRENKSLKLYVTGTCNQWKYANFSAVSVAR